MTPAPATVILGSLVLFSSACATPCDTLAQRAEDCHTHRSRYVDDQQSVCTQTRQQLTPSVFDPFARCVVDAPCDDLGAIPACRAEHLPTVSDACLEYRLWAAACHLEPRGTEHDCDDLVSAMTPEGFESWAACVMADGCPVRDDARYDYCQDVILPPAVAQVIDACVILSGWTTNCANTEQTVLPIVETSIPACLAVAELFVSDSFLDYAQCLDAIDCDDMAGQLSCVSTLRLVGTSDATAPCERLVARGQICGQPYGGGSVEICTVLLAGFTPDSIEDYVSCLESRPCDDWTASFECALLLELP